MLKDIRYFIDENVERQEQLECSWANTIEENRQASLNAFKQTMPTIYHTLKSANNCPESVFVNKDGELDIVDTSNGKALYGYDVNRNISEHLKKFEANPLTVSFNSSGHTDFLPKDIEVLVVFGIGLGPHLLSLLQNYKIRHLVIYEPNLGYLNCSLSFGIWGKVFNLATQQNTAIYLQTDINAKMVMKELGELYQAYPFDRVYVYQHYHTPEFDDAVSVFSKNTLNNLGMMVRESFPLRSHEDFLPPWPPVTDPEQWSSNNLNQHVFKQNIDTLLRFFPDIAKEFEHYVPSKWKPLANVKGEVNIFHIASGSALYGESPLADEMAAYNAFVKTPTKERLALGSIQGKTSQFSHQKMARRIEGIFKGIKASDEVLPEEIGALLLFGIGAGYKLEKLYNCFNVDCFFVCEPNRDYFFASLYAIDWKEILTKANIEDRRIYLNIGDDGSNLAKDLTGQFNAIGTHVIEAMYFSIGYDNQQLVPAAKKLREELRGIVALGEYFDYSRYGVAHTKWAIENKLKFYSKLSDLSEHVELSEVPVFIVGNGPSLDKLLPVLKEERGRAVVISCGTALQVLYKHGISPDFHAEIESNRDTFDWAVRVGSFDFLKKINLLSCNGVHPDTIKLFNDAFLSFKEGEASTVTINGLATEKKFPELKFAYPTVSNFVLNFSLEVGFKQLYLFGVDLGFVDGNHHHSKDSGYYKSDGTQLYDYLIQSKSSLVVKGNFRHSVLTKFEFNMARQMIEKAVAAYPKAYVYNLNDGAAIEGCLPLKPESVLLLSSTESKKDLLQWILESVHSSIDSDNFGSKFKLKFDQALLIQDVGEFIKLLDRKVSTKKDIRILIGQQRAFLIEKYLEEKSIFFYYFNGSINYINSVLIKITCIKDGTVLESVLEQVLSLWRDFLDQAHCSLSSYPDELDIISSAPRDRQNIILRDYFIDNGVELVSTTLHTQATLFNDSMCVYENKNLPSSQYQLEFLSTIRDIDLRNKKSEKVAFILSDLSLIDKLEYQKINDINGVLVLHPNKSNDEHINEVVFYTAVLSLVSTDKISVVVPKSINKDWLRRSCDLILNLKNSMYVAFETRSMIAFCTSDLQEHELTNGAGDRFRFAPEFTRNA
ncbi:6-hydroxymethylpterin diphosphokinase MptE-like protein [Alteromonas mediterranea]|uniref:DUF115 domain-containing protein n=1 Tax=Alteromonas mediterranea TaxID=314275 RepID=A0AAC9ACU2_9ALTE|nr:6-hydroxymethylpterin diphosphokinase MptE-like protein [Alteromonas mediterranea]AFV84549.1 hypothetical protein amad1_05145 [Alteromonas mediterranea DE1]AGP96557.1 hypothetical protein I635_05120 [Alteromonas mediterranea UM7]AGQ00892.1 hypothetical protein I636_05150 [Alteromonas mediterranea UM4b]AMJ77724.1 hypothetical protein AV942_05055 [Alteromonas mediterranea]AMJ81869.1 hypothetical protein AV941_05070 [Alteromonas mediterranea]|tara:strand:- start:21226 stop:24558 length:3333 start_codon:yes stop_codon:yes gene_type:complete